MYLSPVSVNTMAQSYTDIRTVERCAVHRSGRRCRRPLYIMWLLLMEALNLVPLAAILHCRCLLKAVWRWKVCPGCIHLFWPPRRPAFQARYCTARYQLHRMLVEQVQIPPPPNARSTSLETLLGPFLFFCVRRRENKTKTRRARDFNLP